MDRDRDRSSGSVAAAEPLLLVFSCLQRCLRKPRKRVVESRRHGQSPEQDLPGSHKSPPAKRHACDNDDIMHRDSLERSPGVVIARDPSGSWRVGNVRAPLRFLGDEVGPRVSWQVGNSQARFKESTKESTKSLRGYTLSLLIN